jgi:hypothetical protein
MKFGELKSWILSEKALVIAVALSAAWHIFWLSAVTVTAVPKTKGVVRFSKVSFLGPILARKVLDVSIEPGERLFLEKRYLKYMEGVVAGPEWAISAPAPKVIIRGKDYFAMTDGMMKNLVKNGIIESEVEPSYGIE